MNTLSRLLAAFLTAVLLSVVAIPTAPRADALSSFDAEVLRLINEHRGNLGVQPLIEWQPYSDSSLSFSRSKARAASSFCNGGPDALKHDTNPANWGPPPPQGHATNENVLHQCGYDDFAWDIERDTIRANPPVALYRNLPANCRQGYGSASALRAFCIWVNSDSHRGAIEDPRNTHIGLGTVRVTTDSRGGADMWSTNRFASAPGAAQPAPPAPSPTTCNGRRVTVDMGKGQRPTQGADVIMGTSGADVIRALGGNDTICAGGGADVVSAGTGNDYIDGGGGDDKLFGGAGADRMLGGQGNDRLHGNFGNDEMHGQDGNDRLYGYGDNDTMYGGNGNDIMHGNFGNDRMWGGNGNDRMWGYGDDDLMYGDGGNDLVVGNRGNDEMYGGTGGDTMKGSAGNDRIYGQGGNDILEGNFNPDYLSGGLGNDRMDGGPHGDTCVGDSGTDSASRCEKVESTP